MGIMSDRLNDLVSRASSPDGQIEGTYGIRDGANIRFRDGSYGRYRERDLEYQLARLATLVWTRYQRGYDTVVADVSGSKTSRRSRNWDANRRRFREEQATTLAEGMSHGEFVYIQNTGMLNWHIVIRDGTISKLDERGFVDEFLGGYAALTRDYRNKMAELRTKHYGPGLFAIKLLHNPATR